MSPSAYLSRRPRATGITGGTLIVLLLETDVDSFSTFGSPLEGQEPAQHTTATEKLGVPTGERVAEPLMGKYGNPTYYLRSSTEPNTQASFGTW
jgi:hypothetical protein